MLPRRAVWQSNPFEMFAKTSPARGTNFDFANFPRVPLSTRLAHVTASGGRAALDFTPFPGPRLLGASSYKWRTRRGSFARKPCDDFGRAWLGRPGQLIVLAKRETIFDGHVASIDVVALRQAPLERYGKMRCVLA